MSLQLIPDSGNPGILLGKVGPLRVHVAILDQKDDGLPDEAGPVEWYVTSSEYRGDWARRFARGLRRLARGSSDRDLEWPG